MSLAFELDFNGNVAGNTILANNFIFHNILTANGSSGNPGQILTSGGTSGNVYWYNANSVSPGPIGSNTQIAFNNQGLEQGDSNLVWIQTNATIIINGAGTINSLNYSGTANNTLFVGSVSAANVVANAQLIANLGNYQTTVGLSPNVATLTANNSSYLGGIVAASYQGTANLSTAVSFLSAYNSTYLNGQLSSYYLNASNMNAGTLPWVQAPTGTVNTSGNFTLAGNITYSSNLLLQSTLSANGGVGTAGQILTSNGSTGAPYWSTFTSGVIGTNGQISYNKAGVASGDANLIWATVNSTLVVANGINIGLTSTNTTINNTSFSGTSNNSLYLGGTLASGYQTTAGLAANSLTLTSNSANYIGTLAAASVANTSTPVITTTLEVGAVTNNVTINTTAIFLGNSTANATINSSVYTGTSNNSLYLGGTLASGYQTTAGLAANSLTLTSNSANYIGTLAAASVANTSAPVITTTLEVGAVGNNVTINTTAIFLGNSTANATINSSVYTGTSNNSLYLGGTIAFSFANTTNTSATNITAGTLPWAQAPSGTVNTAGNFTLTGNVTYSANLIIQGTMSANGGVGTQGYTLYSNGSTGSPYWGAPASSGPIGSTTQIAFNKAGTESGDANLIWAYTTSILTVNGTVSTNALALTSTFTANGGVGTSGQVLASNGVTGSPYWTTFTSGAIGATTQIAYNKAGVESGDANLTWTAASSTLVVNGTIDANAIAITTTLSANGAIGTSGQVLASGGAGSNDYWTTFTSGAIGTTTQIAYNKAGVESGDANLLWYTANGTLVVANGFILGTTDNSVITNTTIISIGNATVFSTVNSTVFSQTSNNSNYLGTVAAANYANTTNTSATNITAGTLPWAQAPTGTANTSAIQTFAANITFGANIILTSATGEIIIEGGYGAAGNVIINSTAAYFGNAGTNSLINSTVYSGTANNATYLNGTLGSSYALTSALSSYQTTAGLSANVNALSPTFVAGANVGANVLLTTTNITVQNTAAAYVGNVATNSTTIFFGNNSVNATINSTIFNATANNANYLGGIIATSYANTTNTSATNITSGTLPWAQAPTGTPNTSAIQTFAANITFGANVTLTSSLGQLVLEGGLGAIGNVIINSTAIYIGNSAVSATVNSSVYNATANNATYLNGTLGSSYVLTSALTSALTSYQTTAGLSTAVNALNPIFTTSAEVGAVANNVTVNTTSILLGNATVFSIVNSTTFTQTANNASYLGGTVAASYANTTNTSATNITAGTLPWAQAPTGTVNNTGNFTMAGNTTFSANLIIQGSLSANGGLGTGGQILTSNGTTGSPYWSSISSGAVGTDGQIAYNKAGVESGDANLLWYTANGTLSIANSILIGAGATNTTINTTSFSGTSNNSLYLGGTLASGYQTTAGLSGNVLGVTSNSANYIGTLAAASVANTSAPVITTTLEVGAVGNNVTINTTAINLGNGFVNATINSSVYTGTANNTSYLGGTIASSYQGIANISATAITTGTLPWAQVPTGTVNTSGNFTLAGNITYSANITLNTGTNQLVLEGGYGATGNVIINSTAIYFGNSTVNTFVNSSYCEVGNTIIVGNGIVTAVGTSLTVGNNTVNTAINSTTTSTATFTVYSASPQVGGRITSTTGTPVLTSTVTAATTVYFTPYKGNLIPLWNGSQWVWTAFTELSNILANSSTGNAGPAAAVAASVYDLFVWNNSGTPTLTRGPVWTSGTARANGIQLVNGIYVNTSSITNGPGALTGTYVGTIMTDSGGATVTFNKGSSASKGGPSIIGFWNNYNRISVTCTVQDSNTSPHTYISATWRGWYGSNNARITLVRGLDEETVYGFVGAYILCGAAAGATGSLAVGVDANNAQASTSGYLVIVGDQNQTGAYVPYTMSGLGTHYIQAIEQSDGTTGATYYGSANSTNPTFMLTGTLTC